MFAFYYDKSVEQASTLCGQNKRVFKCYRGCYVLIPHKFNRFKLLKLTVYVMHKQV